MKEAHFFFWFKIISESIDLILDLGFIHKMNHITDPHVEQSSKHILGFAMCGTMLYVLTIISLLRNSRNDVDEEHPCLSLLSTVTEDLPRTLLAINVAINMKHFISGIQIIKAIYGSIEPIIRIIKIVYDGMNEKNTTHQNTCTKCLKWWDVAFSVILCLCSIGLIMSVMLIK